VKVDPFMKEQKTFTITIYSSSNALTAGTDKIVFLWRTNYRPFKGAFKKWLGKTQMFDKTLKEKYLEDGHTADEKEDEEEEEAPKKSASKKKVTKTPVSSAVPKEVVQYTVENGLPADGVYHHEISTINEKVEDALPPNFIGSKSQVVQWLINYSEKHSSSSGASEV